MFIKDITPKMLDLHIINFCNLTGMEYTDLNELIFPMIIEKYGKYDVILFPNAFKDFVTSGKRTPSKFAFNFICGVLNDYLTDNHTQVPKYEVKRLYVPKIDSKEDIERMFKNNCGRLKQTWVKVYHEHRMELLSLNLMKICWDGMLERGWAADEFEPREVNDMVEWIREYESKYINFMRSKSTSPNTKTIYDTLSVVANQNKVENVFLGAAKFALTINKKTK